MNETLIRKEKLPKGLSYPLQTQDIVNGLHTESLAIFYRYDCSNPGKMNKWTVIDLFDLHCYPDKTRTLVGNNFSIGITSIESKLRKKFREILCKEVLPLAKTWQELNNKGKNLSVHYRVFQDDYLGYGGIYMEENRYGPKKKILYRNDSFNIDEDLKVIYEK
jgi:hypothetical protein